MPLQRYVRYSIQNTALLCTALHYTTLYYNTPYCNILCYTSLHCTTLHYPTPQITSITKSPHTWSHSTSSYYLLRTRNYSLSFSIYHSFMNILSLNVIKPFTDFRSGWNICHCDHLPCQHPASSYPAVRTRNDPRP